MAPEGDLQKAADVVIVGGGIMGTSAAFFLARETDLDVLLLEKDAIGSGSTGDSSAILRHHYGPQEIYTRMAWWSHQFYRRFENETGQPIAHANSPLVRAAEYDTVAGEYALAGYEVLSSLDIPVRRYEPDELRERYPMVDFGKFDFAVSDEEAAYSDGADAASGFARAARRHGASVETGVALTDFDVDDGSIQQVQTDAGAVECAHMVLAAGPWTGRLAERLDVTIPIHVEREQIVILEPPSAYRADHPELTPTTVLPGGRWYIRPDFGGGILAGTHHSGDMADPNGYDNRPDEATLVELTRKLEAVMPAIGDAGIKGRYCGLYSTTPDQDFVIDRIGPDNCYVACGFSGHGFKHGPAVGRIITDLVVQGGTDFVDLEFFSLRRFDDDPAGHGLPDDLA